MNWWQRKSKDWNCPKCNFLIFGSKDKCYKCGTSKNNSVPENIIKRQDDWNCSKCNFLIFGSKDKCFKCGTTRAGTLEKNIISDEPEEAKTENEECMCCCMFKKNIMIKSCHHMVLCKNCALLINKCPMCRVSYNRNDLVKIFI